MTSCYVEYGAKAAKNRQADLNQYEKMVVNILEDVEKSMSLAELRNRFFELRRSTNPEVKDPAIKVSFGRAIESLTLKLRVLEVENIYLLTSHANKV